MRLLDQVAEFQKKEEKTKEHAENCGCDRTTDVANSRPKSITDDDDDDEEEKPKCNASLIGTNQDNDDNDDEDNENGDRGAGNDDDDDNNDNNNDRRLVKSFSSGFSSGFESPTFNFSNSPDSCFDFSSDEENDVNSTV